MYLSALMILLGLMGRNLACNHECRSGCKATTYKSKIGFKHLTDLGSSSVAPWSMRNNVSEGRLPESIPYAHCETCIVEDMIAKPILFRVPVYERPRNVTCFGWCECPFVLSVGCTCVKKQ